MKEAVGLLAGIARPIPDVATFVTPVFRRTDGNTVVQRVNRLGRVDRFDPIGLGEEFEPIRANHFVYEFDLALYAFEIDPGCIAFGSAAGLADLLAHTKSPEFTQSGIPRHATLAAVGRFVESATPTLRPASDYSFVIRCGEASADFRGKSGSALVRCIVEDCRAESAIPEDDPKSRALRQFRLGNALQALGEHTAGEMRARCLREAAEAYESALAVYSRERSVVDWEMSRRSLNRTLRKLDNLVQKTAVNKHVYDANVVYQDAIRGNDPSLHGLLTVEEFRRRVELDPDSIVKHLKRSSGQDRSDLEEWHESLRQLARFLDVNVMPPLQRYLQGAGHIALEYRFPNTGFHADVVLLGAHEGTPVVLIIELKGGSIGDVHHGRAEGLFELNSRLLSHPSDQARGFAEHSRHFHSAVRQFGAKVYGCALITRRDAANQYVLPPHDELAREYPVFTLADDDVQRRFPQFLESRLSEPHRAFAEAFITGHCQQDRNTIKQAAEQVSDNTARPFELLGNQRLAFALCKQMADEVVRDWSKGLARSKVITVFGPPGSGKSAIAARLWAELLHAPGIPLDGKVTFVTTTASQHSNWSSLIARVHPGSRDLVRSANAFYPVGLGQYKGQLRDSRLWRDELQILRDSKLAFRDGAQDKGTLISIVDEAHALVNPEHLSGNGIFGFPSALGPQAYHIMRSSRLTVIFIDPHQSFRFRENTTIEDLRAWALELGAEFEMASLEGAQFRCAGSAEYVNWVERLLRDQSAERNAILASAWHIPAPDSIGGSDEKVELAPAARTRIAAVSNEPSKSFIAHGRRLASLRPFEFRVFDDPFTMEEALRQRLNSGDSARLLSSYSRKWKTNQIVDPHCLPPTQQDFCEPIDVSGETRIWYRPWNVIPKGDYAGFIQGTGDSAIARDMLAEVGCTYAVRGFDFDYVGLLWMEDLVWRENRWQLNLDSVWEPDLRRLVLKARREYLRDQARSIQPGQDPRSVQTGSAPATIQLIEKVQMAYRILLTRALKGVFVWVKDEETRRHVRASLAIRAD